MEKPIELHDDELAAVAGGWNFNFTDSFSNNLASFAYNSNNNAFNHSFNSILSGNTISLS